MSLCTRAGFQETDVDSSVVCAMPALLLCSWALYLALPLFCTSLYASALSAAPALLRSRHARSLVMLFDSTSTSLLYFVVFLWFPNISTNTFIWSEILKESTLELVTFFVDKVTCTDVGKLEGSPWWPIIKHCKLIRTTSLKNHTNMFSFWGCPWLRCGL